MSIRSDPLSPPATPDLALPAARRWSALRRAATVGGPWLAVGVRGLATGLAVTAAFAGGLAAETFHTGWAVVDWAIGITLVVLPLASLNLLLTIVGVVAARLLRAASRRLPDRAGRASAGVVQALQALRQIEVSLLIGVPVMVWGSPANGPLSLFQGLFFYEIPIATGGLVGMLVGLGTAPAGSRLRGLVRPRTRRLALVAGVVPALVLATVVGAWTALPGPGDPIVRESAAALAVIPELTIGDPSEPGPHAVATATYGTGTDRRDEYGAAASWHTQPVDASAALEPREGMAKAYGEWLFGFGPANLPVSGHVWYAATTPERMPVVLIAHGNHDAGDASEEGYAYLGEHLASRGFATVSVDENFLNGDPFAEYGGKEMGVRAWLLLRHLDQLRAWNGMAGHPLEGRLDLGRVALIGHSRGGEAAAIATMLDANERAEVLGLPAPPRGFGIRAVIALAPSDGMYTGPGAPVTLKDVDYLVVQGAHDGDLPAFSGLRTYHRVAFSGEGDHLKVAMYSERANHGRFNRTWDIGDAGPLASWMLDRGSLLSAADQERLARTVVTAFLGRSLEGRTEFDAFFREPRSGRSWLPDDVLQSHWQTSDRATVEAFGSNQGDIPGEAEGFTSEHRFNVVLRDGAVQGDRALAVTWSGPAAYRVSVPEEVAATVDPAGSLVFAMVASRDGDGSPDPRIRLVDSGGRSAAVQLSDVAPARPLMPTRMWKLDGLADRYLPGDSPKTPTERFLVTYAIPLTDFAAAADSLDLTRIRSIGFEFDGTGAVFLDDIAFERPIGR
jgi:hypothetical protein